jgi:hypothetical protein
LEQTRIRRSESQVADDHHARPAYVFARAAWIPTLVIWHADGRFTRLEGAPCADYTAALAASWRLRPARAGA